MSIEQPTTTRKSYKRTVIVSLCCAWSSVTSSEFISSGHAVFLCHPMCRGSDDSKGSRRANPAGKSEPSLFVWFNITLVYPWMDAKTFEFKAKEQATATYGCGEDQIGGRDAHALARWVNIFMRKTNKLKKESGTCELKSQTNNYILRQGISGNRAGF